MRGKRAKKRIPTPDAKYNSLLVSRIVNKVMQDGKKKTANTIVYNAIEFLAEKTKEKPVEALDKAIANIKPKVEIRSRRIGGANFQIPVPVSEDRQETLAVRWLIEVARSTRKKQSFSKELGNILYEAYNKEGAAYKKKEDTHRMAEANKAFAQFAW